MKIICPHCGCEEAEVIQEVTYLFDDELEFRQTLACYNENCNEGFELVTRAKITNTKILTPEDYKVKER